MWRSATWNTSGYVSTLTFISRICSFEVCRGRGDVILILTQCNASRIALKVPGLQRQAHPQWPPDSSAQQAHPTESASVNVH
jgi:hypothetical protein